MVEVSQKVKPHPDAHRSENEAWKGEVIKRPPQLHIVEDLNQNPQAMAHGMLGGAVDVVADADLHLFYSQIRLTSVGQHLALDGKAALLESKDWDSVGRERPKSALGIGDLDPAVEVSGLVKDDLAQPAV